MNICFETFGCRLSRAEALEDEARVQALGHNIVTTHADADAIILRGCSVTARAQHDCENMIRHLKRKYPNKRLFILGCLPDAQKTFTLPASHRLAKTPKTDDIVTPTRTARAYLKIQDGCAGTCTFCIVPKFRGASTSVPFDTVLAKASRFIESGYHEIVVTGCNLALYASAGKRLPDLLAALAKLDAGCRIRLGSLEPWGCADEVVDVLAENENVCRFLHIPAQSGSDRILKLMNRPYLSKDVVRIVKNAAERMPLIALGCDLIAGFPGESEIDFIKTKDLLTRLPFSKAHIFPYSERPGTAATKLPGLIRQSIRTNRARTLNDIAKENRRRFARRFVGKEVDVVIESHSAQSRGWTSEYLWFEGPMRPTSAEKTIRKQRVRFIVRSSDDAVLHGVPANHGRRND